jgi:drug/metabolite transporter (DMT)-like permease
LDAVFIVIGRVLASPFVNVFQKKLINRELWPEFILMLSYLLFVLLAIPVLIIKQPFDFPVEFWIYILLLGVFDVFGNMFLVKSLQTIDLSVFGPLNAFKPVFALVISVFLLDEIPGIFGVIGVLIIIAGSYLLGYQVKNPLGSSPKFRITRGLVYRFLAIFLTSVAAVFSKKTILMSSPLITLVYWSLSGFPIALLFYFKKRKPGQKEVQQLLACGPQVAGLLLSFLFLQMLTLLTFERIFVGYSLALFQLSGLVSVFFGYHFFQERNLKYRLIGATIMCAGTVLIALSA